MASQVHSTVANRRDQMFPVLAESEIARIARFGTVQRYACGDRLFTAGQPGPGMFIVLKGIVAISQRDGLGNVTPIVRQGPGEFLAEVGQLSGGRALVDGDAEEAVETLLISPEQLRALIIAEADLGERIMRALILRRVALIESGATGPVLIGNPESPALLRLRNFLRRNGHPHGVVDVTQEHGAAALLERDGATASEVVVVCPDGSVLRDPKFGAQILIPAQAAQLDCRRDEHPGAIRRGRPPCSSRITRRKCSCWCAGRGSPRACRNIGEGAAAVALIHQCLSADCG